MMGAPDGLMALDERTLEQVAQYFRALSAPFRLRCPYRSKADQVFRLNFDEGRSPPLIQADVGKSIGFSPHGNLLSFLGVCVLGCGPARRAFSRDWIFDLAAARLCWKHQDSLPVR